MRPRSVSNQSRAARTGPAQHVVVQHFGGQQAGARAEHHGETVAARDARDRQVDEVLDGAARRRRAEHGIGAREPDAIAGGEQPSDVTPSAIARRHRLESIANGERCAARCRKHELVGAMTHLHEGSSWSM